MIPGLDLTPLWAVHIQDGVLTVPWMVGGYVVAAALAVVGAWRIRDEEIPRVAVLAAAFFVASLIHVPVPGGPRTHLLLNGLLGVVLGRRAALAIPVGLALQMALFGHGGLWSLGVNSCVMTLPALLAWLLFAGLRRVPWVRAPWFRAGLVAGSTLVFVLSLVYSVTLLLTTPFGQVKSLETEWANQLTFHPATLLAAVLIAAVAAWAERRLENAPEFPLGLLVGQTAVLATVFLNCLALLRGGQADWHTMALLTLVIHLPLALVEGVILGFTVGFLARVKPELLGWPAPEKTECVAETVP
jgi:cobalt/nickel transport system permease protein